MAQTFLILLILISQSLAAENLKASIAQMPVISESKEKGFFPEVIRAMERVSGRKIEFDVVPFARSMSLAETGKVDFHLPLIEPLDMSKANFSLSTETLYTVNFVLYTNKKKPLDLSKLKGARLETDLAHVDYFPFRIEASSCLECSLKKVNSGRIDGFIFADTPSDPIIKDKHLNNIRRQLYRRFDVKFVLKKGANGGPVDKFISETLAKLRKSGELQRILGPFSKDYAD